MAIKAIFVGITSISTSIPEPGGARRDAMALWAGMISVKVEGAF